MSNMRDLERSVRKHQTGSPRKPATHKPAKVSIGPVQVSEVKPNLMARAKAALRRIFRAPKGR